MTGLHHVGPLRVQIVLDLTISGAAVVHYSGKADSGFVSHAITSEGNDLIGLLPTETMLHLQDAVEAAAQIDARALLNVHATPSPLPSRADKTPAEGAVASIGAAPSHKEEV